MGVCLFTIMLHNENEQHTYEYDVVVSLKQILNKTFNETVNATSGYLPLHVTTT